MSYRVHPGLEVGQLTLSHYTLDCLVVQCADNAQNANARNLRLVQKDGIAYLGCSASMQELPWDLKALLVRHAQGGRR